MTREEIKRRAELYSALAEGKTIQILNMEGNWVDVEVKKLNYIPETLKFRIKPKSNYRPFETQKECWDEMLKHQPFGWIVRSSDNEYLHIGRIHDRGPYNGYGITLSCNESIRANFDAIFKGFKFVDGTPFGINEKKQ